MAGLRSLLMQALHPLAMAGVDQHSDWRRDPVGRLAATQGYVTTVTFGERAAAERAAARVRGIHTHVRGTDLVTGKPYAASDPALLLWVHVALVDATMAAARLLGAGFSAAELDRYVAEMVVAAELVGVPRDLVPASVAGVGEYLAVGPARAARHARRPGIHGLPAQPARPGRGHGRDLAGHPVRRDRRAAGWAWEMYGYPAVAELTPERRTEIRQTLGVLDALFLGEPGVLEARQRITLRTRAARAA